LAPGPRDAAPVDHYAVLGVARGSSAAAIKAAYRALVKRHHPDAGGDSQRMLALNAAWEVLGDGERRRRYDAGLGAVPPESSSGRPSRARQPGRRADSSGERPGAAAAAEDLRGWLRAVYAPLDRLLGQVIAPFPAALRALAADPYDDALMEAFCAFLSLSRSRLSRAETLYRSRACPDCARGFGLSLYHCLAQLQDAVSELERYTLGYVDSYLHDGREMVREVRLRRQRLHAERRRLEL
jgi:molecular chaperone DnaJ